LPSNLSQGLTPLGQAHNRYRADSAGFPERQIHPFPGRRRPAYCPGYPGSPGNRAQKSRSGRRYGSLSLIQGSSR
jgi:hypothetical protein